MLLFCGYKGYTVGVFAYKEACHVGGLMPFQLFRHVVIYQFSVYTQVLETYVFHCPLTVVAGNY